jgi:hypothetical protein
MTLYQEFETDISFRYLEKIVAILERPICIIGGWAVYFTVNEHFKKEHGRNYLGSKDIDLGFYIDKNLDKTELKNTDFGRSMAILEELGFQPLGFRLYKDINVDTGEDLTPEQSRKTLSHNIFKIYVDPIVSDIPLAFKEIFGFTPIDEPLISLVFQDENNRIELTEFNKLLWLPKPEILLATKVKCAPTRTKDEKLIKDICDIYALSWHSGKKFDKIKDGTHSILDFNDPKLHIFQAGEVFEKAGNAMGIDADVVKTVIEGLYK